MHSAFDGWFWPALCAEKFNYGMNKISAIFLVWVSVAIASCSIVRTESHYLVDMCDSEEDILNVDNISSLAGIYQRTDDNGLKITTITAAVEIPRYKKYLEYWQDTVERIGRDDYPEIIRKNSKGGDLILDVVINSDGTLRTTNVLRSSGDYVLNDVANEIIAKAAPFLPFPECVRRETDVLHIPRRWKFQPE